jgi:hypothetical protein
LNDHYRFPSDTHVPGVVTAALTTVVLAGAAKVIDVVPPPEETVVVNVAPATPAPAIAITSPLLMPVPLATVSVDEVLVIDPVVTSDAEVHAHPLG